MASLNTNTTMKKIPRTLNDAFGLTGTNAVREKTAQEKAAREKAPVAAEFESCTERFDRLNIVMEANETTWEPYHILLNDYRSRLATWGIDTGASSRTIDHTLRKASRLKGHTLDILEELHASLQNSELKLSIDIGCRLILAFCLHSNFCFHHRDLS